MALKNRKKIEINTGNLITDHHPESLISEQFKAIRTNIQFSPKGEGCKTLLITSPDNSEEKLTTTAVNLAISIVQDKKKVLLIDANIKQPSLHSLFYLSNELGLTDVLLGKCDLEQAIHQTEIARLEVMTSGQIPFISTELFGLKSWKTIMETKLTPYDKIIINAPSILNNTDTKLLANQCDGVILILSPGKTKLEKAIDAKKILSFAHANVVGTILNHQ
ncbi:CpsD/CapB family tyrosine-protein kinase [Bacillus spongiae]|uniref:non-specific protein-tyrosine kinase n=1 Tax=Bacillus spongiae TaxID=2683610 RepID=A0ABU8HEZ6_9BACI